MLNVKGDGWSVHTNQNVLDVHEGIGYDVGSAHAMIANMPGFVTQFIPAGETLPAKMQDLKGNGITPVMFSYNPFAPADCTETYG